MACQELPSGDAGRHESMDVAETDRHLPKGASYEDYLPPEKATVSIRLRFFHFRRSFIGGFQQVTSISKGFQNIEH